MRHLVLGLLLGLLLVVPATSEELTDADIRKILIEHSIRAYSGACPCPYNVMRNGRRCGKSSAYSWPGGAEPLCYEADVTDEMVERYWEKAK